LERREPDRVPVDFAGHRSSGIMAIAYPKLRELLGLPKRPTRVFDVIQQLAIVDEDVLDRFGVDTIELGRGFAQEDRHWKPWCLPDGSECLIPAWTDVRQEGEDWVLYSPHEIPMGIQKAGSLYFEQIHWPYLDGVPDELSGLPDVMPDVMWTLPAPPEPGADLAAGARKLRESTDRAIVAIFGGNLMEWGQFLCRIDGFLMLLAGEPDRAHALLDRLVEIHLGSLETFMAAVGPYVDVVSFGDDLGMQTGPQISAGMYDEFFKPRHERMWKRAKELADVKVMLHCCGGIRPLIPSIAEAGADTFNPVQITCSGMESKALKRDFGDRIAFWGGGCDTRSVLPQGTPDEVRRHVLGQLDTFAPGGGFVFQQVHNVMSNVPVENVVAMFDAVAEFNGLR
jgi:uroporphyrinogen decarboxylase